MKGINTLKVCQAEMCRLVEATLNKERSKDSPVTVSKVEGKSRGYGAEEFEIEFKAAAEVLANEASGG